jgi:mono/diheme cytochrome c family protein
MYARLVGVVSMGLCCCGLVACSAKPPGSVETKTAYWIKQHITVGGRSQSNPIPATAANIDAGKHVFAYYCVECHGRDGQNTGVPFAAKLAPPVPSMASREVQAYTDGQLKWIIDNGIFPSGMPASKGTLSDEEIWQIVLYLRDLPRAGSLGDPKAYSGDEYETGEATGQPKQPN